MPTYGVSTAVLSAMRNAADAFMTDTCRIERYAATTDTAGAMINAWSVVVASVKCRLITIGQRSNPPVMIGEQPKLDERYRIVLPAGTSIDVQYRIVLSDGSRWLVQGLVAGLTNEVSVTVNVEPEDA